MRVTVIGAGVAGLACATALVERGVSVEVLERSGTLGADAASWLAGGMLAPWCECESAEEPVARLGAEAVDWWSSRVPGVVRQGTLVIAPARDTGELHRFAQRTSHFEWLDEAGIGALEPDLGGRFRQGLYFPTEAHLNPRTALSALHQRLMAMGVGVRFGTDYAALPERGGVRIDCRGFAARDRLADLRGVRGEMLVVRSREIVLRRPVRMLHPRHPVYVVPRDDGLFMIGATMLESGEGRAVTARSAAELIGAAFALHPAFGEAEIVELGAGIRPAFRDNLPRIRRRGRTLLVNGLHRHGFLLAPALARMTAEAVLDPHTVSELMDEDHREWADA
jgi:glycine oxidase